MGETEDSVVTPAKMQKSSKKNKTRTNDLQHVGDKHVDKNGDLLTQKGNKLRGKKRKSETIEDGDQDQDDKGNSVNDADLPKKDKKKRKKDFSEKVQINENEQGQDDEPPVEKNCDQKMVKKNGTGISPDNCQEDVLEKNGKKKKKKTDTQIPDTEMIGNTTEESTLKTQGTEDKPDKNNSANGNEGEDQYGKGNLVNDGDLQKKVKKKKRKRDSSEQVQIKENRQGQDDDEATVEKDCDPKPQEIKNNTSVEKQKVKKKSTKSVKNNKESKAKGKSKKVSFSSHVEVLGDTRKEKDGLIQGKRFTPEEDEIIKKAVLNFIEVNNLGENGLEMVLNCKSHPGLKKCWQEIATCIPYRTVTSVYYRGHILFERAENSGWTPEEIEHLKELYKKHGNAWKKLAQELGKHRFHVKDAWRRIKFENTKPGKWSQEEYQNLYDLVNLDLQMKINGEKKSKHGMLRDNIPWTAISEKLSTRSDATICSKWYNQLTSSLVAEKKWSDTDDYRMIGALYELDATCVEDVDWDNILEHRPGDICRKRWDQMVKHIGHQGSKPFSEQVDTLAKRYCPDLADTREAWDNKPLVP